MLFLSRLPMSANLSLRVQRCIYVFLKLLVPLDTPYSILTNPLNEPQQQLQFLHETDAMTLEIKAMMSSLTAIAQRAPTVVAQPQATAAGLPWRVLQTPLAMSASAKYLGTDHYHLAVQPKTKSLCTGAPMAKERP